MNSRTDSSAAERSAGLLDVMRRRRSCRSFSEADVPPSVVENCIAIAGTAPNGANMQPWTFVLVSDARTKKNIRAESERVEAEFYSRRIDDEWRAKLEPLDVRPEKPFLTEAAHLICVFVQKYGVGTDDRKITHYYARESVGIATGFLLSALHQSGLACLTYTPAPMGFLSDILERPDNERPYLLIAVGYQSADYQPPALQKKPVDGFLVRWQGDSTARK